MAKPSVTTYTDKLLTALASNHEGTMSKIRQQMHDNIPKRAEGHVGQAVIDALCDVEVTRSIVDIKLFIKFVFRDPDENLWWLHREFSYRIDPQEMENAEAYMWEQAMSLNEEEFAQLALVLT